MKKDSLKNNKKKNLTLYAKIKRGFFIIRITLSLLSMILYTVFIFVVLFKDWASTVYLSVIFSILAIYIILFAVVIFITFKNSKLLNRSIKDYKSGLKILKALLTIISFALTLTVFAGAAVFDFEGNSFQTIVLIISLVWAAFQIIYQISKILKRHEILKKNKKSG